MKRTALFLWFVAVAVLVAANSYVCYVNVRKLIGYTQSVARARDTIFALDRVMSALKDAETAERGYVITQDQTYLKPYENSTAVVRRELETLDRLVDDQTPQQPRVDALRALTEEKLAVLVHVIDVRRRGDFDSARDAIQFGLGGTREKPRRTGKQIMDEARETAETIRENETAELARRSGERDVASVTATTTLIGSGILNVALLLGLGYFVRRQLEARATHAAEISRNARLAAEVEERRKYADALASLNQKLEISNRELQDFAYVASHDLQEPLRKIQAFGDRLRKRFADPLGEDGADYVDRMHNAASRMQTLIDDLLTFARVTTKAQPATTIDLAAVANGVLSDLEARIEATGGTVLIASDLPPVKADPTQLRQILQNLISNALKFRKPGVPPVVKLSAKQLPQTAVSNTSPGSPSAAPTPTALPMVEVSVADNGIGFDEKYLDRIFNVFQRLHGRQEYEGTGIGLAVVRKIVERHGGTITATSREGEGATFRFTLPAGISSAQSTTIPAGAVQSVS